MSNQNALLGYWAKNYVTYLHEGRTLNNLNFILAN